MNMKAKRIVVAQMKTRTQPLAPVVPENRRIPKKRLLRNTAIFAVASLCIGTSVYYSAYHTEKDQSVMSRLTAGFEYDESLGRLQFVKNMLPESAMVFFSNDYSVHEEMISPSDAQITHAWNQMEPWLEYAHVGDILACQDGEVMTVVKNRQNEYTIRLMHQNGYESVYSGLSAVQLKESDLVQAGQPVGTAAGNAAFELRRDGLSVLPVFTEMQ